MSTGLPPNVPVAAADWGKMSAVEHALADTECADRLWDAVFVSPSIFGRLLAVAGLHDPSNGRYGHPLANAFGAAQVDFALRRMHREIFEKWQDLDLQRQERDVSIWLSQMGTDGENAGLLRKISGGLQDLLPLRHAEFERQLFLTDFQMLMVLIGPERARTTQASRSPSWASRFARLWPLGVP